MRHKILLIAIAIILFGTNSSYTQSIFSTQEDVADYLEGEWNVDVVAGIFGNLHLPSSIYYDSTIHKVVFETTEIDSTPLICRYFIQDTLHHESHVSISQNPSQIIFPRWILINLPDILERNAGIMETFGFYGFSQDTLVISGNVALDGFEFGIVRTATTSSISQPAPKIEIYPNPSSEHIFINGIQPNTLFELYDLHGKLVNSGNISNNHLKIESNGIFVLRVLTLGKWISKKIVIQK